MSIEIQFSDPKVSKNYPVAATLCNESSNYKPFAKNIKTESQTNRNSCVLSHPRMKNERQLIKLRRNGKGPTYALLNKHKDWFCISHRILLKL